MKLKMTLEIHDGSGWRTLSVSECEVDSVQSVLPVRIERRESTPSSVEAVREYAVQIGAKPSLADEFHDYFSSNGWKVSGKAPMKDWRAAFRNWARRSSTRPSGRKGGVAATLEGLL